MFLGINASIFTIKFHSLPGSFLPNHFTLNFAHGFVQAGILSLAVLP
jgi:hypothetical protein